MDKDNQDEAALEALFSAGRAESPVPSDDFMARLAADAEAAMPSPASQARASRPFLGGLSAWFAASGLSGAAVLGVWIGFVMPEAVSTFSVQAEETVGLYTFLPGADLSALTLSE